MTEQNIIIRNFEMNDISTLTDLTNQLGYETTIKQMTERMAKILVHPNYWTFVAVADRNVVGYIGLTKNFYWEQDGEYLRIQALVVDNKYRKHGVGQKLLISAEQLARQNKINAIILNCGNREERQSAHKFYPKMGFEAKSTGYIKKINKIEKK